MGGIESAIFEDEAFSSEESAFPIFRVRLKQVLYWKHLILRVDHGGILIL